MLTQSEKTIKGMLEYNIRLHQIEAGFVSALDKRIRQDIGRLTFDSSAYLGTAPKDVIGELVNYVERALNKIKDDAIRAVESLVVPMWATQKHILFNVPTAGIEQDGDTFFDNSQYQFESIEDALNVDILANVLDDTFLPILLGVFARWVMYMKLDVDTALRAGVADNGLLDTFGNFDVDKIVKTILQKLTTAKSRIKSLMQYAVFLTSNRVTKTLFDLAKESRSIRSSVVTVVSAILDSDTCAFCLSRHGKILKPQDEYPPYHGNCRCFVSLVDTDELDIEDAFSSISLTNPDTGRPTSGNYQNYLREYGLRARDLPQTKIIYDGE